MCYGKLCDENTFCCVGSIELCNCWLVAPSGVMRSKVIAEIVYSVCR